MNILSWAFAIFAAYAGYQRWHWATPLIAGAVAGAFGGMTGYEGWAFLFGPRQALERFVAYLVGALAMVLAIYWTARGVRRMQDRRSQTN